MGKDRDYFFARNRFPLNDTNINNSLAFIRDRLAKCHSDILFGKPPENRVFRSQVQCGRKKRSGKCLSLWLTGVSRNVYRNSGGEWMLIRQELMLLDREINAPAVSNRSFSRQQYMFQSSTISVLRRKKQCFCPPEAVFWDRKTLFFVLKSLFRVAGTLLVVSGLLVWVKVVVSILRGKWTKCQQTGLESKPESLSFFPNLPLSEKKLTSRIYCSNNMDYLCTVRI